MDSLKQWIFPAQCLEMKLSGDKVMLFFKSKSKPFQCNRTQDQMNTQCIKFGSLIIERTSYLATQMASCQNHVGTIWPRISLQTYLGNPTKLKTHNQNAKTMISPKLGQTDGQSLIIYANLKVAPTHLTPAKIPKLLHAPMSKYFSFPRQTFAFHSRDRAHLRNKG